MVRSVFLALLDFRHIYLPFSGKVDFFRTCTKGEETVLSGPRMYEKIRNYIIMGVRKSESPKVGFFLPPVDIALRSLFFQ